MLCGLVVTHGGIGKELVKVVELVLGPVPGLAALTNSGKSVQELIAEIRAWSAANCGAPGDGLLLFIDDFGGSCANAAQIAAVSGTPARILTGINLAMLLDFVTWRDSLGLDELPRRLVEKGRDAITALGPVQED
jgi:mannose PTS system EIIA component